MKDFRLLIWVTQLGISVAGPLALCTIGAIRLRSHFGLGNWVPVLGILVGISLAIDGFCTSLKAMNRCSHPKNEARNESNVSFNDHH